MAVYQVLTENHLILWSFEYQQPCLAAEDTQGLPQVYVQLSKLKSSKKTNCTKYAQQTKSTAMYLPPASVAEELTHKTTPFFHPIFQW